MKKVILALAIVSVSFAACNSGETKIDETKPADTTAAPVAVDTAAKAVVIDTAAAKAVVVDTMKKK